MPTMGRARSASVKPMPFNMARAGARSRPLVIARLRDLGSKVLDMVRCSSMASAIRDSECGGTDQHLLAASGLDPGPALRPPPGAPNGQSQPRLAASARDFAPALRHPPGAGF